MLGVNHSLTSPNKAGTDALIRDYYFSRRKALHSDIVHTRAAGTGGATQTNSSGLVAYAPHNLLPRSNEFTHSDWNTPTMLTANATVSPTGETNASEITSATTAVYDGVGTVGDMVCVSVYAKKNTVDFITLSAGAPTSHSATFNLTDGTVAQEHGTVTTHVSDEGNGWYRIGVSLTSAGYIQFSAKATGSYTASRTTGVYVYGAQVERILNLTVGPQVYNETTGSTYQGPRFDYDKDGNSKGLLVEMERTNKLPYSQNFSHADWGKTDATIVTSGETDPTGGTGAYKFEVLNTSSNDKLLEDTVTVGDDETWTLSLYAKKGEMTHLQMILGGVDWVGGANHANFNLTTGQVTATGGTLTTSIQECKNGWFRCSITATTDEAGSANCSLLIANSDTLGGATAYVGAIGEGIHIFGAQMEEGSFPTSYIPNYGTSAGVTRAADIVSVTGTNFSRWYRQDQGTVVMDAQVQKGWESGTWDRLYQFSTDSTSNSLRITSAVGNKYFNGYSSSSLSGGDLDIPSTSGDIISGGEIFKTGLGIKQDDFAYSFDGNTIRTDTNADLPVDMDRVYLGSGLGLYSWTGWIRRFRYYSKLQPNTKIQSLTDTSHLGTKYKGMKAGHSLRSLFEGQDNTPVVRVRRDYDNVEADYTADQISDGSLSNDHTPSKQTTLPLDISCDASELIEGGGTFTEIITNGSMEADSNWNVFGSPDTSERSTTQKHSGTYSWYIDASAHNTGIQSTPQFIATKGKKYTVSMWIYATEGTEIRSGINNTDQTITTGRTVTADQWTHVTYVATATATGYTYVSALSSSSTQNFYVDDVSVVEGGWTLGAGWTTGDGIATHASGSATGLDYTFPFKNGKTYDITFNVLSCSGGSGSVQARGSGSTVSQTIDSSTLGVNTFRYTDADDHTTLRIYAGSGTTMSVDNISVKEVSPSPAGFSLRKIKSDFTGNVLRVRNQDDDEMFVKWDENDEISMSSPVTTAAGSSTATTLEEFAGTGYAAVVEYFDQNGGTSFTQSTGPNQPKIVESGALVVDAGGKPSLSFDSSDLLNNASLSGQSRLDGYFVTDTTDTDYVLFADDTGASRFAYLSEDGDTSNPAIDADYGDEKVNVYVNGVAVSGTSRDVLYEASKGHSLVTTDNATTATWGDAYIGSRVSGREFTGKISEMVFYPNTDTSQKRFPIEQNQMNHFGVTLAQANFEANISAFGKSEAGSDTSTTISHETSSPLSGTGSLKIAINGTGSNASYPRLYGNNAGADNLFLPADPVVGEKYKITMTTKVLSGAPVFRGIGFGDQGGSGEPGEVSGEDIVLSGTQTHVFEKTLTDVAGSNTGRLHIALKGTVAGTFLLDSLKVEKTGVQGFVTKLYDQSNNNNHAEQTTAANQPKLVAGGDVITTGGKPAMEFDGSNDYLPIASDFNDSLNLNSLSSSVVYKGANTTQQSFVVLLGGSAGSNKRYYQPYIDTTTTKFSYGTNHPAESATSDTDQHLITYVAGSTLSGWRAYLDGTALGSGVTTLIDNSNATDQAGIGAYAQGNSHFAGTVQEVVIWDSDQSANRSGIDTNINTHYSIY